ncbi:MGDG synthase family glycosyltransferase [Paenibacillus cremeus]|uniref:Glycosyltransferase n=1 Tax=Paenibacillus cremeus TaxID=2163881 RepID=A0A559KDQ3_9BACL|nr:glycosyltransferase [Paenibacillus cremeus]TVY10255.1 glycosyltransferase [Paenibacillus cremeus]
MKPIEAERRSSLRVLLLSGDLGDGHKQAAKALAEACGSRVQTEEIDFMQGVYPHLHPLVKYFFLKGLEKAPSLYGYLYRKTKSSERLSMSFRSFLKLGLGKLADLLAEKQPDIVVCTFPLAAAAVSLLKAKGQLKSPLVTVITDHTDHSLWLHPHTDLYLVGSESVADALKRRGIAPARLCVTGIPVRQRFFDPVDRTRLCHAFGLSPELPTVLVMGGGCGLLGAEIRSLINSPSVRQHMQTIILCGSNVEVRCELEEELRRSEPEHDRGGRVIVKGYVEEIHEWMAVADLLVTKPGGLTTAEAVAMGLPMLLYKPIPGQEEDNAAVLEQAGVAVRAAKHRTLRDQLLELVGDRDMLRGMREEAGRFRFPQPSQQAWEAIWRLRTPMEQPVRIGRWSSWKVREVL